MGCGSSANTAAANAIVAQPGTKEDVVGRPLHQVDAIERPFGYEADATRWVRRRSNSYQDFSGPASSPDWRPSKEQMMYSRGASSKQLEQQDVRLFSVGKSPLKEWTPRDASSSGGGKRKKDRERSKDDGPVGAGIIYLPLIVLGKFKSCVLSLQTKMKGEVPESDGYLAALSMLVKLLHKKLPQVAWTLP
ncbi:unnamed protein product [Amoebophrya sp. A120]|nr:unnamed protein product [Amoebophrya sp. A120]|eukprot:GSA120T00016259001.1